ncbi:MULTISPECIES: GntR family transcriptional regulator [Leuconostoc]|uniref:Arabinose operon repressor n=2 Tax=Leuconostoc kimchii TaxID=136609 RepID=D5T1N8_LEUKI|nr:MULTISPECIES: GntR family transcriptional regulator [Leuconostoc]ADG40187.1 arabinose operon repressor [Leuconostoc kimchii IMSNU 11154]AEJ31872.1 arabinose operon repressor [Leuconostoc sp. C2]QBR46700.1 GntR family transcriptional regulator [Leuconostoc kimchii]
MKTNKYEVIKQYILDKILSGEYTVDQKLPTESELMALFLVSRYTVRRAISDLENEKFIYRIQGGGSFVADRTDISQKEVVPQVIGFMSTHIASYIFPAIIDGVDQVLSKNNFSFILANTHNDPVRERAALKNLMRQNLGGLIVEPTRSALETPNIDLYLELEKQGMPIVFINAAYKNFQSTSLVSDDQHAFYEATNYLFKKQHKRIVGIFQVDDLQGVNRLDGYLKAYQDHSDLLPFCKPIMYQSGDVLGALNQVNELLLKNETERPTAIIAYNDQLAIRIMDLINDVGLKVPSDISIIGFDDFQLSQYMSPRLTTMTHAQHDMGRDAALLLLQKINHRKVNSIVYKSVMIERDSVRTLN